MIQHFSAALLQTESLAGPERLQAELDLDIALGVPLAMTLGYAAPEVERVYRRAAQLCAELGEPTYSFPVISALAQFSLMRGRYHEVLTLGERFLALALRQQDRDAELEANFVLGAAYWYLGPARARASTSRKCCACTGARGGTRAASSTARRLRGGELLPGLALVAR